MKKFCFLLMLVCSLVPLQTYAKGKEPCSGKKGGVSHCSGSKFVCQDGSISQSKKICRR